MIRRKRQLARAPNDQVPCINDSDSDSKHHEGNLTDAWVPTITRLLQAYLLYQTIIYLFELALIPCSKRGSRAVVAHHDVKGSGADTNVTVQHSRSFLFASGHVQQQQQQQQQQQRQITHLTTYTGPQRTFPIYPYPFPCVEWEGSHSRRPTNQGFLYIKEMKTASSTLAGVTLRIARNVAKRRRNDTNNLTMCRARFFHMRARKFQFRLRNQSFLWSMVREPNARMLSKFFHFAVSRKHIMPTAQELAAYYASYDVWIYDQAYYLKSLSIQEVFPRNPETYVNATQSILDDYDFIGITERLDESLVVLQLLLGLETQDILYLSSKSSESFEKFNSELGCSYLIPKFESTDMRLLFQSPEWINYTMADQMLYQAVNHSLDRTIQSLGRDVVDRELGKFKWAQELAFKRCIDKVLFPCTLDGKEQTSNCLYHDSGCGYQCLDQVGEELHGMKEFQTLQV